MPDDTGLKLGENVDVLHHASLQRYVCLYSSCSYNNLQTNSRGV